MYVLCYEEVGIRVIWQVYSFYCNTSVVNSKTQVSQTFLLAKLATGLKELTWTSIYRLLPETPYITEQLKNI